MVANGAHAWLKHPVGASLPPAAVAAFGTLAPLALLGITELIARLVRLAQHLGGAVKVLYVALGLALLMALLIASAAFGLSFAALSEFGAMAGIPAGLSWLVPCIIDGAILAADIAVVAASTVAKMTPGTARTAASSSTEAPGPVPASARPVPVKATATRVSPAPPFPTQVMQPALVSAPTPVPTVAPSARTSESRPTKQAAKEANTDAASASPIIGEPRRSAPARHRRPQLTMRLSVPSAAGAR